VVDDSSSFVTEDDDDSSSIAASDASDLDVDQEAATWSKESETLGDRFYALKDMIAPSTRDSIKGAVRTTGSWIKWTGMTAGSAAWIITTSALLVGLPLGLCIETEAGMIQQEKEYNLQANAVRFLCP
jgi:import receptor subunit TOM22